MRRPRIVRRRTPGDNPFGSTTGALLVTGDGSITGYLFVAAQDGTPSRPQGLVVPFAGLSPGMAGVYHIDVTIPAGWRANRELLQCHMDSGDAFSHGDSVTIDVKPAGV